LAMVGLDCKGKCVAEFGHLHGLLDPFLLADLMNVGASHMKKLLLPLGRAKSIDPE
jgi:hypothetical protein